MKKQRKIDANRNPITKAEIQETKLSFENLKAKFNNFKGLNMNGLGLTTNWIIGIISTVVISSAIWFISSNNNNSNNNVIASEAQDSIIQKRKIKPPFPEKLVYEEFEIDNSKQNEIFTENGTKITIEANSFVDENNQIVSGNITIMYIDFHNPLEIYYSGIPMQYDSLEENYTFMSGGMFDISAEKNDKNLYLAKDKYIDLELVSYSEEKFNFYEYDTISNQWNYLKTENDSDITQISSELQRSNEEILALQKEIEMHNDLSNNKTNSNNVKGQLNIKTNTADRYIVNVHKGQLAGTYELYPNQGFKEEYYKVAWDNISVERKPESYDYILMMEKGFKKLTFIAYPTTNADTIQMLSEEKKTIDAEKQKRLALRAENYDKIKQLRAKQNRLKNIINNGFATARNIRINRLNIYNCDRPLPEPQLAMMPKAIITDQNGNEIDYSEINICQPHQNVLWTYAKWQSWKYSGELPNVLWIVSENNKVHILQEDKFQDLETKAEVKLKTYELEVGLYALEQLFDNYAMN